MKTTANNSNCQQPVTAAQIANRQVASSSNEQQQNQSMYNMLSLQVAEIESFHPTATEMSIVAIALATCSLPCTATNVVLVAPACQNCNRWAHGHYVILVILQLKTSGHSCAYVASQHCYCLAESLDGWSLVKCLHVSSMAGVIQAYYLRQVQAYHVGDVEEILHESLSEETSSAQQE